MMVASETTERVIQVESRPVRVDTKLLILSVAARLFAESGFDAVTLRDIAAEARVNNAAINYHFVSKELLIKAIFNRLFTSMNRIRLESLDHCEARARKGKPDVEGVVRALVEPTVRFCLNGEEGGIYFARLLFHAYCLKHEIIENSIAEQVDHIVLRFVSVLQAALPRLPRTEIFWRFDFAIGACYRILIDPFRGYRLQRLSGNLCKTDDGTAIIEQLVSSLVASFAAPPPQRLATRTRNKSTTAAKATKLSTK